MSEYLKRAWAEIHLDRLGKNVGNLLKITENTDTVPMGVVKANAYGHDDMHVVMYLQRIGINYFAVSNIKEAEKLRSYGCTGDILILGYTPPEYADELIENNIIQAVVSFEHAKALSENAVAGKVRVHAAVDTGMGRIGIVCEEINKCADSFEEIYNLRGLDVEGALTHYASADSMEEENILYTENQTEKFFALRDELNKRGIHLKHFHCLNSAGAVFHFDKRSTLARFGIILYGLKPDYDLNIPFELIPVMDLKASVSYVKTLKKGSYVSYGRTFMAEHDMKTATIPIGYADGCQRQLSGKASVIINGKKAPIIGRICMDQLMADVTDIDGVHAGTEVTLFGGECGQTADDLAKICGTIGYEMICGISKRVPRIIMDGEKIIDVVEYY